MFAWVFANYVNSKAPTLDVKIFPNSGLGQSRQVIEAMQLGSGASMHVGGMAEFANFCKAKCGVIGLPFIFSGYDHVQRVLDGPVGAELSQEMETIGFKVLGYLYSWGYRNVVTAKKEIKTVADLKGSKIRTIPTPVFVGAVNAMGASATPMNFGEVYTSLQSGVLDGYEHTATTTASFKFYEIAKYYALTQHLIDPTVVAFSLSEWKKLDAKEQAVVTEGAKLATDIARAMSPVRDAEGMAESAEARHDDHQAGHDRGPQGGRLVPAGDGGEAEGRASAKADTGIAVAVATGSTSPERGRSARSAG